MRQTRVAIRHERIFCNSKWQTQEERVENVAGTFAVMRPAAVKGRTVLLVDDVMTTGSTLSEAAAELKRAGAKRVWCVSLARSIR